jgi:hypothetical protein
MVDPEIRSIILRYVNVLTKRGIRVERELKGRSMKLGIKRV